MGEKLIRPRVEPTCRVCSAPIAGLSNAWHDAATAPLGCPTCRPDTTAQLPRHTTASLTGTIGGLVLGEYLDLRIGEDAYVLHDRTVPGTRGNIDHVIVAASGVWLIDAAHGTGTVEERDYGGWFQSDLRLYVNGLNQTRIVADMHWQVHAVDQHLVRMGFGDTPIHRALCFTDTTWKRNARPFRIRGVVITWPEALADDIGRDGSVAAEVRRAVATEFSARFPAGAAPARERSLQR